MSKHNRLDRMQRAVQLAGFHYIACLKARPSNADHKLTFGKSTYDFMAIAAADSQELHSEFQGWAATSVLRDLVENFSIFLMEVYRDAVASAPSKSYTETPDRFERMGVEDQLATLSANFSIDTAWTSRLTGYNRARNCLAHRAGIVAAKDATDGDELVVRWLTGKVTLTGAPAVQEIEAQGPMSHLIRGQHVEGGGATMEVLDRERRFKIGTSLHLMPDELLEICQTIHIAAAAFDGIGR